MTMNSLIEIRDTHVGKGVFAKHRFLVTQLVGTIEGQQVSDPNYGSAYCFDLENGMVLEPAAPFRYVNHSCDPNCEIEFFDEHNPNTEQSSRSLILIVCREIQVGEELTIDYNWDATNAIRCLCGAENCRGWIVAPEELAEIK